MLTCLQSVYKCLQERINMYDELKYLQDDIVKTTMLTIQDNYKSEKRTTCIHCGFDYTKNDPNAVILNIDGNGEYICFFCCNELGFEHMVGEFLCYTKFYHSNNDAIIATLTSSIPYFFYKEEHYMLFNLNAWIILANTDEHSTVLLAEVADIYKPANAPPLKGSFSDIDEWIDCYLYGER